MKIAFIVDQEVFHLQDLSVFFQKDKYAEAFFNHSEILDSSQYPDVKDGYLHENGFFYFPEDTEKANPLTPTEADPRYVYISFIKDGIVLKSTQFDTEDDFGKKMAAGLLSNPQFMDVSQVEGIEEGWTWDGQFFNPPMNG